MRRFVPLVLIIMLVAASVFLVGVSVYLKAWSIGPPYLAKVLGYAGGSVLLIPDRLATVFGLRSYLWEVPGYTVAQEKWLWSGVIVGVIGVAVYAVAWFAGKLVVQLIMQRRVNR